MRALKLAAGALTLAVLLAACGPAAGPAPTPFPHPAPRPRTPMTDEAVFAGLMAEVEARNRGIDAPSGDLGSSSTTLRRAAPCSPRRSGKSGICGLRSSPPRSSPGRTPGPRRTTLFRLLRTYYGLYTWFGGDDAFGAAEEGPGRPGGPGEIPLEEYRELLLQSLDFINDGHFVPKRQPACEAADPLLRRVPALRAPGRRRLPGGAAAGGRGRRGPGGIPEAGRRAGGG